LTSLGKKPKIEEVHKRAPLIKRAGNRIAQND